MALGRGWNIRTGLDKAIANLKSDISKLVLERAKLPGGSPDIDADFEDPRAALAESPEAKYLRIRIMDLQSVLKDKEWLLKQTFGGIR